MCGLVGFAGSGTRDDLALMLSTVVHRGPDGEGIYIDPDRPVFLGHRRLAILDIEGGQQPMWNEDGEVAVIFNGEIYNHLELRAELQVRGHVFSSDHSDTEVLVHGYEEWGANLPERLNGMFAFIIYDRTRRVFFLARDRFGEKPLFYTRQNGTFAFASEVSALCAHRNIGSSLSIRALQKFFAHGFLPAPWTAREGIEKLPAGCHLTIEIETGKQCLSTYWQFSLQPDPELSDADEGELAEQLRELLFRAARRRLISDVPLGVFLSGGIDSSAVAAGAASGTEQGNLKTFTIGFKEASFDESEYARTVADALGTLHHAQQLEMAGASALISEVLSRLDEPLGDASILPTYLLCRYTRQFVTVALSGDGGDELFAGYDPFHALAPAQIYSRLVPRGLHRGLRSLAEVLPASDRNMSVEFKLKRALKGLTYAPELWNPVWMSPADPDMITEVFESPLSVEELYSEAIAAWHSRPDLSLAERTLEYFTKFYLPDDILMKVDRAAMLNSLESRAVFLDNDVVDFCQRLPLKFKFHRGKTKVLLKRALNNVLPKSIIERKKKGFGIPLAKWLRTIPRDVPMYPLPGVRLETISHAWHDHRQRRRDNRLLLWSWLAIQYLPPGRSNPPFSNDATGKALKSVFGGEGGREEQTFH